MSTIRKRNGKYEVQVRRMGQPHISRTFHDYKDAQQWARETEIAADRHDLPAVIDRKMLNVTLGELIGRYRDTVTVLKRAAENERIALNAFALHPICRKSLLALRTADFAAYRDERLKTIKPISFSRESIRNAFMYPASSAKFRVVENDDTQDTSAIPRFYINLLTVRTPNGVCASSILMQVYSVQRIKIVFSGKENWAKVLVWFDGAIVTSFPVEHAQMIRAKIVVLTQSFITEWNLANLTK